MRDQNAGNCYCENPKPLHDRPDTPCYCDPLSTLNCTLESIICVQPAAMTTYSNVKFMTSAAEAHQLAADSGREIAFAGRSNSGKSTAINAITQRTGLARVSRTSGTYPAHQFLRAVVRAPPGRPAGLRFRQGARTSPPALAAAHGALFQRARIAGRLDADCRQPARTRRPGCGECSNGFLPKPIRACVADKSGQTESPQDAHARIARDRGGMVRTLRCPRNYFRRMKQQGIEEARKVMDRWLDSA